ncbi:MAG: TDT family transporter [Bifidobacterium psychraerophilum]
MIALHTGGMSSMDTTVAAPDITSNQSSLDKERNEGHESRMVSYHRSVPLPKGGLTLGVLALGALLGTLFPTASAWIHLLFALLALPFFVTIIAKCLIHPAIVLSEDMSNPVVAPVSATVLMSLMQYASYLAPLGTGAHMIAVALWYFAVSCNIVLMVHITSRFVIRAFTLSNVYPTWFVGFVGIVVASSTSQAVGQQPFGLLIFWCGFVLYALTFVVVTLRMFRLELPEAAKPSFCIYAAPMSLSIAGYTTAASNPNTMLVLVMLVCAQLLFVMVLLHLPKLLRTPFVPSYAAMTFPFVITATALYKALTLFRSAGWAVPSWLFVLQGVETVFAAVMVLYVLSLFAGYAARQWRNSGEALA